MLHRALPWALGLCLLGAQAAPQPLDVETAHQPFDVVEATLSPDGHHLLMIANNRIARPPGYKDDDGEPQTAYFRRAVVLVKTADLTVKAIATPRWVPYADRRAYKSPRAIRWITNDIVGIDYGLDAESQDLKGEKLCELGTQILAKPRGASTDSPMVIAFTDDDRRKVALVDARTCRSRKLQAPPGDRPLDMVFDENGELRAATMTESSFWSDKSQLSHWYRPAPTAPWEKLLDFKPVEETWMPMAVDAATNRLIVASREHRDTLAIFNYDFAARAPGEMLAGHPTEDVFVADDLRSDAYESVITQGMKPRQHWFTPRWAALQASIDAALPKRINRLSGNPEGFVLVYSYSDIDPGRWFLVDTKAVTLQLLAERNRRLDPEQMRPMNVIRYASKDGLKIPAFLTRPDDGPGPRPMVVMIHGGPAARDYWGWDPDVQVFATRGYVVFQPQFRGSTGFGKAFEQAGVGQWGLAMQDDITAGVEHLIKEGIADPKRICIYGTSYGGYAAVWGLIKTPQLYRCGVTVAGVSDIAERLKDWSDTNADKLGREVLRFDIARQSAASLDEVSPVVQAHRIAAPLLISHGDKDERVPKGHSQRLMKAMDKHGKPYEWVRLRGEGHGIGLLRSAIAFNDALLKFLDRHIGAGAEQP